MDQVMANVLRNSCSAFTKLRQHLGPLDINQNVVFVTELTLDMASKIDLEEGGEADKEKKKTVETMEWIAVDHLQQDEEEETVDYNQDDYNLPE